MKMYEEEFQLYFTTLKSALDERLQDPERKVFNLQENKLIVRGIYKIHKEYLDADQSQAKVGDRKLFMDAPTELDEALRNCELLYRTIKPLF